MITEHKELPKDIQDAIDNTYRELINDFRAWNRAWDLYLTEPSSNLKPETIDSFIQTIKSKYHVTPNKFYKKEQ